MESGWKNERETLIGELIQGMELTKQLREELGAMSPTEDKELLLVEGILSSYEKALSALKWSRPTIQTQTVAVIANAPTSPTSIDGSPHSDDFDISFKDPNDLKGLKKRKSLPKWTKQVRLSSETGLEGSCEDGHSWRKYGQKDILGAKYPRSYYRCTFRNTQDCWATKQVQRSDEDPSVFEITYRGSHTCSQGIHTILPPVSPEKQEQKQVYYVNDIEHELQSQKTTSAFLCPSTAFGQPESKNHNFSHSVMDNNTLPESLSLTPRSSYLMQYPCQSNSEGSQSLQQSETSITDILLSQHYSNYFTNSELGFLT